jgi:hypothetical protein
MDIVPPPGQDQAPRLQAFRAEHPDIEIAGPAGSRTGMWPAYQGGTILVVTFGLRQLLDRLDDCSRPVGRPQPGRPRSRSGIAGSSGMP